MSNNDHANEIAIVFDGPPEPGAACLIEIEDAQGRSIKVGRWEHSADGFWRLWIPALEESHE